MATDTPGFFEELKRRHVWRVAVAYAIAAWLLVQVATQVFPFFDIPNWAVRLVVVVLAIGFVIAVVFAWIYELTPEGIRRTASADSPEAREPHDTRAVGRKLNTVIITVLVLAVLLLGNQFVWHRGLRGASDAALTAATAANPAQATDPHSAASPALANVAPVPASTAAIPEKSVAVLPFANEGAKGEQFFSDGLSEDLITALSQFAGLKVISRNSAFQFRDSRDSSAKIGQLLGVAHLLEGSVQRAGDEVRITATLVNASDGAVVWTKRYDKPYKDLFSLQDAITLAVADALQAKLMTAPGAVVQSDRPPSGNLASFTAYQHGVAYFELNTEASLHQAIAAYEDAIRLDPHYTVAYARLSLAWTWLAGELLGGAQAQQAYANARQAADTALKLDSGSSLAHLSRANLLLTADFDWTGAEAEYRRALQLAPNDAEAQFGLGNVLSALGQVRQAVALTHKALAADPRHASWYYWLSVYLAGLGQLDAARQASTTAIALQPGAVNYYDLLTVIDVLRGNAKSALAAAQRESPGVWRDIAMARALQMGTDRASADAALKNLIAKYSDVSAYQIAQVYALRRDADNTFKWLDRAWANRDPGIQFLLYDPFILRYRNDPRFAAFCKKVGLPTTTDAVAMK
ncbi:MAG: tetratricopeptide repeat protein [Proteobacteria bacterium]|nr:tetratricopeptide repeat protein [Pseudomonadota bacterium]